MGDRAQARAARPRTHRQVRIVREPEMKSLDAFDWTRVETELDTQGHATLLGLLSESECQVLAEGRREAQADVIDLESIKQAYGELRSFRSGLPEELAALRVSLYGRLVA